MDLSDTRPNSKWREQVTSQGWGFFSLYLPGISLPSPFWGQKCCLGKAEHLLNNSQNCGFPSNVWFCRKVSQCLCFSPESLLGEVAHWVPRHGSHQGLSDLPEPGATTCHRAGNLLNCPWWRRELKTISGGKLEQTQRQKAFWLFDYFLGLCCLIWTCLIRNKINKNTTCSLVPPALNVCVVDTKRKEKKSWLLIKKESNLCKYGLPLMALW